MLIDSFSDSSCGQIVVLQGMLTDTAVPHNTIYQEGAGNYSREVLQTLYRKGSLPYSTFRCNLFKPLPRIAALRIGDAHNMVLHEKMKPVSFMDKTRMIRECRPSGVMSKEETLKWKDTLVTVLGVKMDREESNEERQRIDALWSFLKTITNGNEERTSELYENCKREKVYDVSLLKKISEENLKMMGFAIGEATSVRASKEMLDSSIEKAVADIRAKFFGHEGAATSVSKCKKLKVDEEKEMIIYIGWKTREDHDGKSTRKTKKAGGGLKEIRLLKKDSTYQNILSQAKYTFLGNDSSLYSGILEVNGQEMLSFCDNDGIECTYAQYLKSNKLFASRCKTYLVTYEARNEKVKNPESGEIVTVYDLSEVPGSSSQNVDNSVLLDSISIVYSLKEGTSEVYLPGIVSVIERESCRDPGILSLPYENVNPLSYGYSIARIRKGSKTFMDHEPTDNGENVKVTYPSAADADKQVLLHGPEEIHGYDLSDYIIGIVVKNTVSDPVIEWFLDGNLYQSGKNLFVINVLTTRLYYATIQYNDEQYTSDAVCIVQDRDLFRVGHVVNLSGISRNTKHDEKQCSSLKEIPQANDIVRISSTDFQIEEEIGKGNYGTVFKGSWLGSLVAIKKLPLSKKGKQTQLNMIKGEIEILSRLRHPNLIQIMAYCIENTKAMILMEFIEGSNLEDLIFPDEKPKIDLTEEFKLSVLLQISRGLAYLHGQKPPIIHQDIKPSNILVSHNLVVKICDLGVSQIRTTVKLGYNELVGTMKKCSIYPSFVISIYRTL